MDNKATSFDKYLELIGKVDAFVERVQAGHPREITCGPGCSECCGNTFSVFAVEAHNLRRGYEELDQADRGKVVENSRRAAVNASCPLLDDGLCLLYPYRPIICRTHGFPFTSENLKVRGQKVISFCDRNFAGLPDLSVIAPEHLLNLDLLNSTLAAINCLFMREQGDTAPDERILIPGIFAARG